MAGVICIVIQSICLLILFVPEVHSTGITRHYFLAAVELDWNYAPTGMNMFNNDYRTFNERLLPGKARIGRIYQKAIFRQFTDATFSVEVVQPSWNGMNGPIIAGEVGDVVLVHFKNMASQKYSIHVHGFGYDKNSEGARYNDGIPYEIDDAVPPGGVYVYQWDMRKDFQPTFDDDNCLVWPYHAGISDHGIKAGLIGFGLTCKPGVLLPNGRRSDVDREIWVYADSMDETLSPYINFNMQRCGSPKMCNFLKMIKDKQFTKSNTISHVNGFSFGNTPDFHVCSGERVVFYMMSLFDAFLTIHINGQTLMQRRQRMSCIMVAPGMAESAYMVPAYPGRWLMSSKVETDFNGGILAYVSVNQCKKTTPFKMPSRKGAFRRYFLAIEELLWNYFPTKKYMHHQGHVGKFLNSRPDRIGSVYKKALFREYVDLNFNILKPHPGLAGPPIKASVGDNVEVVVLNRASRPYSFLANGVELVKSEEGAIYKNSRKSKKVTGAVVLPGTVRVYRFQVTPNCGPTQHDPDCLTSTYHSSVDYIRDVHSGLFGPLLICKPGTLDKIGNQVLYSREFFVNWMIVDENKSWYINKNIQLFTKLGKPMPGIKADKRFIKSNKINAINGRAFGSLNEFAMCLGDRVTWHMYGFGDDSGIHQCTFDGNNMFVKGKRIDVVSVFPGMGRTVTMIPDFVGRLKLYTQHQNNYHNGMFAYLTGRLMLYTQHQNNYHNGMFAYYHVRQCKKTSPLAILPPQPIPPPTGLVRRYHIGALPIEWDYCPTLTDLISMKRLDTPKSMGFDFVRHDGPFIGPRYTKAVFRQFLDDSFNIKQKRGPEELHLGLMGPFVRASVGDTIEIVLKNDLPFPISFSPRNIVPVGASVVKVTLPGTTMLYRFYVPQRSGPAKHGPHCVGYTYSSRALARKDIDSGLYGPLVICRAGLLDPVVNRRSDGVKERAVSFVTVHEMHSHFYMKNKLRAPMPLPSELEDHGNNDHSPNSFMPGHGNIMNMKPKSEKLMEKFKHSNMYHTINGLIYGNIRGFISTQNEPVAWYLSSHGGHHGIHTVHFHGNLFLKIDNKISTRGDVLDVYPGIYKTVETVFRNPGSWKLHCHVIKHAMHGMKARYTVLPNGKRMVPFDPNT